MAGTDAKQDLSGVGSRLQRGRLIGGEGGQAGVSRAGTAPGGAVKAVVSRAAMAAVEPLVELFLELGVTSPEAESLLRSVFVHKAREWLAKPITAEDSPSDARVSLVTGVHRNFVRSILAEPPRIAAAREQRGHRASRLLD